jgi:hypothetical protein
MQLTVKRAGNPQLEITGNDVFKKKCLAAAMQITESKITFADPEMNRQLQEMRDKQREEKRQAQIAGKQLDPLEARQEAIRREHFEALKREREIEAQNNEKPEIERL